MEQEPFCDWTGRHTPPESPPARQISKPYHQPRFAQSALFSRLISGGVYRPPQSFVNKVERALAVMSKNREKRMVSPKSVGPRRDWMRPWKGATGDTRQLSAARCREWTAKTRAARSATAVGRQAGNSVSVASPLLSQHGCLELRNGCLIVQPQLTNRRAIFGRLGHGRAAKRVNVPQ